MRAAWEKVQVAGAGEGVMAGGSSHMGHGTNKMQRALTMLVEAEEYRKLRSEMMDADPTVEAQLQVHGQEVAVQLPNEQLRAWESTGDRLAGVVAAGVGRLG